MTKVLVPAKKKKTAAVNGQNATLRQPISWSNIVDKFDPSAR